MGETTKMTKKQQTAMFDALVANGVSADNIEKAVRQFKEKEPKLSDAQTAEIFDDIVESIVEAGKIQFAGPAK